MATVDLTGAPRAAIGFGQQSYLNDPSYLMALGLAQEGASTAPVRSPLEGAARALTGIVGAYTARQIQKQKEGEIADTMAKALAASEPARTPGGAPGFNPTTAFPDAPPLPAGAKSLDAVPAGTAVPGTGGVKGMAFALMGNPDTASMGFSLMANRLAREQALRDALTKMTAEYGLKAKYEPLIAGATESAKNPALIARAGGTAQAEYPYKVGATLAGQGMTLGPNGVVSAMPGYAGGKAQIAGSEAKAKLPAQIALKQAIPGRAPVPGIDTPLPALVAQQKADIAAARGGQFYLYPTGAGTVMVDKRSGVAQMVGRDSAGNLVGIGKPFKPNMGPNGLPAGATGAPTVMPNAPASPVAPGGVTPLVSAPPGTPSSAAAGTASPLMPPSVDVAAQGNVANVKAAETAKGKVRGTAEANLPAAAQSKDYLLGLIDAVSKSPDLGNATGFLSILPNIPGFNTDIRARIDQLKGQNFLQAYNGLRGGGQITEVEGKKAEDAQARLNRAQTTEEFRAALKDMADLVRQRFEVQKEQAGAQSSGTAALPAGPSIDDLLKKYGQ